MPTHNSVFYFNFYNQKTKQHTWKGFLFNAESEFFEDFFFEPSEECEEIIDELESKYGVHDFSCRPADGINSIGYTSYEIDPSEYDSCMNEWRTALINVFGNDISDVFDFTVDYQTYTDNDVFNEIMNKIY